jgi:hypothetical protein
VAGRRPDRTARPWIALGLGFCAWELLAFFQQTSREVTSYDHPTMSALTEAAQQTHIGRSSLLALWLLAGSYLARL